ncbi:MAG: 2-amino-4-hydroxy-6-hydroxymethyldihydropteridine diphosphokinase [Muribaculaceae bacterium]|nr:2-amino-4-hydroxy-6-hydroxymethyldihydropteridine diphosphokinase [Muribaculaceae bacterium]
MVSKIVLSLGSNCDADYVAQALKWLKSLLSDFKASSLYETPPAKGVGRSYINAVITGSTQSAYEPFNRQLKEYEELAGRDQSCREAGLVPIDIDIVIWNDDIIRPWDYRQNFFKIGYAPIKASD